MNTNTPPDGPADGRHTEQPNLYGSYPLVDLNFWETDVQRLADACSAAEAMLTEMVLRSSLPHSPALNAALSSFSLQDKIYLLKREVEHDYHEFPESGEPLRCTLDEVSSALAAAHSVVGRFMINPSNIAPEQLGGPAIALEQALAQLKTHDQYED